MVRGLYVLGEKAFDQIYGPDERADIAKLVDICAPPQTPAAVKQNPALLADAEVIFSGWGGPKIDDEFLAAASELRAVFYGAGSIKGIATDAFWDRGILITSAYAANAIPVAEFTISQMIFCLKRGWQFALSIRRDGAFPSRGEVFGAYGSTVGIISLGMVGRRVCSFLKSLELHVLAYDPFASESDAAELGVELVSLDDIFRRCEVVSLHTPWLKETEGMITGRHLRLMKQGATFINTARGAVVREGDMIDVLRERPDLFAVLDVTHPEPPAAGSPVYSMENVVLTPHMAGSMGAECYRQGRYMVDELRRYLAGEPLKYGIDREKARLLA